MMSLAFSYLHCLALRCVALLSQDFLHPPPPTTVDGAQFMLGRKQPPSTRVDGGRDAAAGYSQANVEPTRRATPPKSAQSIDEMNNPRTGPPCDGCGDDITAVNMGSGQAGAAQDTGSQTEPSVAKQADAAEWASIHWQNKAALQAMSGLEVHVGQDSAPCQIMFGGDIFQEIELSVVSRHQQEHDMYPMLVVGFVFVPPGQRGFGGD
jgi:hypothetical protein